MTKFSANLGFLWQELSLPNAIRMAKKAGFDAVECHWPYDTKAVDVKSALHETGLNMLGLNTRRGDVANGFNGLSALPDHIEEARAAIDESLTYASEINCRAVHVMAGFSKGIEAHNCFVENLRYACAKADKTGILILIEPLNKYDAPDYFLQTTDQAVDIINSVGASNLKLMFDCYHVQLMEGDLTNKIAHLLPHIGHIQFAGIPGRSTPDQGEINFAHVFKHIKEQGYSNPLGAEYKPNGPTEPTLDWLKYYNQ